jgi:hypothetical protein
MSQIIIPHSVFNDLTGFISATYSNNLPNSLLIAQAFILKYPEHGRKYGLTTINQAVEEGIRQGLFGYGLLR